MLMLHNFKRRLLYTFNLLYFLHLQSKQIFMWFFNQFNHYFFGISKSVGTLIELDTYIPTLFNWTKWTTELHDPVILIKKNNITLFFSVQWTVCASLINAACYFLLCFTLSHLLTSYVSWSNSYLFNSLYYM